MAKKYAYWLNSGKYSMLQQISVLFFGVLGFMMLTRMITPSTLGVWALFLLISSIVETSRNALIRNGYILYINTREKEEQPGVEYAAVLINVVFSLLLVVVFFALGGWLESILKSQGLARLLYLYCGALLLLIPFSQIEIFLSARTDFKGIFMMYCLRNIVFIGSIAVLFLLSDMPSLPLLAATYSAGIVAGLVTGYLYSRRYERVTMRKDMATFRSLLHYGKYVYGNNFFSLLFRSTDNFLTANIIGPAATAFYSSCARITNFVDMPSQVLGDIMFPKAAQVMKNNDRTGIRTIYEKAVAGTLSFTFPAIAIIFLFPREILFILAGEQYTSASGILQIMVFYGAFLPFIRQFGNVMDAMGKPRNNFVLMMCFAAINLGSNYLFIQWLGIKGAAIGTLVSYFLLFLTTQIVLHRMLKVSLMLIFKNIFLFYLDYIRMGRSMLGAAGIARGRRAAE